MQVNQKLQKARSELQKESHAREEQRHRERERGGWKEQREGSGALENDATDWHRVRLSSPKCGPRVSEGSRMTASNGS